MLFDRNTGELKEIPSFEDFVRYVIMDLEDASNDEPHWRSYK